MRKLMSPLRVLVASALLGLCAGVVSPAKAAPARQEATLTIFAIGFADLAGGDDPNCPGCDEFFDPEADEPLAAENPLPALTFTVLDGDGNEVGSFTTEQLATLQRGMIDVPDLADGETYTLELTGVPDGWELCASQSASRELTVDDFMLGSTRQDFFLNLICDNTEPTAEPTVDPGLTAEPTQPGATDEPGKPGATPKPTKVRGNDDDDDDDDDDDKGGSSSSGSGSSSSSASGGTSGSSSTASGGVGMISGGDGTGGAGTIMGLAFIDADNDGKLGPNDPGLNDVGVHLEGGGMKLYQVTPATGQFSFAGLGPGEYDVYVTVGSEWRITTPARYKVKITGGKVGGVDFGMNRGPAPMAKAIRMPATGVADLPAAGLAGILALFLSILGGLGFVKERRRQQNLG